MTGESKLEVHVAMGGFVNNNLLVSVQVANIQA